MAQKLQQLRLSILGGLTLLALASCANQANSQSSLQPAESIAAHPTNVEFTNSTSIETTENQVQPTELSAPGATGNLLSPEQVAHLTALPIPIVAPTYLPEGFRVVRADGETGEYSDGDIYAGYTIAYQGNNNTCFAIYSSQDSSDRLQQVGQVETALGTVNIHEDRGSLQSFILVRGNPVMISPSPFSENCQEIDRAEYERILQSIELVN